MKINDIITSLFPLINTFVAFFIASTSSTCHTASCSDLFQLQLQAQMLTSCTHPDIVCPHVRFMLLYVCRLFCVSVSLRCFPRNVSYYRCQNESRELTFIVSLVISCWVENEMSHREVDLSIDLLVKKLLLWPLVTVRQHAGQSGMCF